MLTISQFIPTSMSLPVSSQTRNVNRSSSKGSLFHRILKCTVICFSIISGGATRVSGESLCGDFSRIQRQASPPNILAMVVDDLGIDYFSRICNQFAEMGDDIYVDNMAPNMRALCDHENSVSFINTYANPTCSASRAALLTGRHSYKTGVGMAQNHLDSSETCIPSLISDVYDTALIGKWHLTDIDVNSPVDFGFKHFEGIEGGQVSHYYNWNKHTHFIDDIGAIEKSLEEGVTTYSTTEQVNNANEWLNRERTQPWFLWVGFNAPHDPFQIPPYNLIPASLQGDYDPLYAKYSEGDTVEDEIDVKTTFQSMITALDTEIGRLLENPKIDDNTVIMLMGDNGTPGEVVMSDLLDRRAKGTLYELGIRVPLVIKHSNATAYSNTQFISAVDVFSTVLDYAETSVDTESLDIDSLTLKGKVETRGDRTNQRTLVLSEQFDKSDPSRGNMQGKTVRGRKYKLVLDENGDPTNQEGFTYEFYNVLENPDNDESDPGVDSSENQALYDRYKGYLTNLY